MTIEPATTFSRTFRGYEPAAVDASIEAFSTKQQFLLNDIESLRGRLKERDREVSVLRNELADLVDTSSSPRAMQLRMAKMLQRAVDEISEMQAEARAEAQALIAAAETEVEAEQQKHREVLADMVAKQDALSTEYEEAKKELDGELAAARQDAQQQREQLLADAKQEADYYREQARREAHEAREQRIKILEQLMGVYRDLEEVPPALESAYREAKDSPDASA